MKNFILINYNVNVDKIYIKDDTKYFFINNERVYIFESNIDSKEIDNLVNISNDLYRKGIKVYTFILNNDNKFYTEKDDKKIALLKVNDFEDKIDLEKISKFKHIQNNLKNINILDEWIREVDDLEKELLDYNKEYQIVQKSINYFIGCAENSIELIDNYKQQINSNNDSIGHLVDFKLYNKCILDNPFTFVRINSMYDISNYIKYKFFRNEINYDEIEYIINGNNEYENAFLFASLLYPNVYFDLVKKVLNEEEKENKINFFINRISSYKELLIYIQKNIKNVKHIKLIHWLSD
jgi:hypothetical protein